MTATLGTCTVRSVTALLVWGQRDSDTGDMYGAKCNCVVGLGAACNHVAALLFIIEAAMKQKLPDEPSRTSLPMRWNQPPRTKHVYPSPLRDITFHTASHSSADSQRCDYDPRAPEDLSQLALEQRLERTASSE